MPAAGTTNVFVAYADIFVGKRVLAQFQQYPAIYRVYGCTWDAAAADQLNGAAVGSSAEVAPHDVQDGEHNNHTTVLHLPPARARTDTAPLPEHPEAESANAASFQGNSGAAALTGGASFSGLAVPTSVSSVSSTSPPTSSSIFFGRRDTAAVQAALLACDWIVLELRQAQTVLEAVQFLQAQPSFVRSKRLVLLSSLMTWYATPPLEGGDDVPQSVSSTLAGQAGAAGELEEDDETPASGEDSALELEAPYPPPPAGFFESLLTSAQEAARHATVDAMRGDHAPDGSSAAEDESNPTNVHVLGGTAGEEGEEDAEAAARGAEVLTEDQFNRRVPHLHYLSWRDAEKAVAAAHHAKGLPLDTFVVCSGLPYGGEEDVLEPLFRQAWSATAGDDGADDPRGGSHNGAAVLPIFGNGSQRVPLVHVQDLACFVRKLLRCPTSALPFPERRYLFATDGTNANSWLSIVTCVNRMFGQRCTLQVVPPASYPLYRDVGRFTMNLRVAPETMKALMDRTEEEEEEAGRGQPHTETVVPNVRDAAGTPLLPSTWIAEGGVRRHLRRVAAEFTAARGVTPLRIALVGPPLVGKTYLAARLARYYRLPCVSLDSVIAEYTAALQALRTRLDSAKAAVLEAERTRRLDLKRRRVLLRQQRGWDTGMALEGESNTAEKDDDEEQTREDADGSTALQDSGLSSAGSHTISGVGRESASGGVGEGLNAVSTAARQLQEVSPAALALTAAEEEDLKSTVEVWWSEQPLVQTWKDRVGEMERVLLLRLHPRPPTPDANPKRRAAGGAGGGNSKKRSVGGNKDTQKAREDEEEVHRLKASLQHAPFQARALTLMLRWRLAQPDCRVQGFVLDGVPATVELARLVFAADGEGSAAAVQPPGTEEEALRPHYVGATGPTAAGNARADKGGGADGAGARGGGPVAATEAANAARLPDHVVVLQASDTFLLNRLMAIGAAAAAALNPLPPLPQHGDVGTAPPGTTASAVVDVETFQQHLQTYKREYVEAPYSVLNYFECAVATYTVGGVVSARRAAVHPVAVEGHEPFVPSPPPTSAYAEPEVGDTERLLEHGLLGPPHNFGKSLEEVQRDAVRQRCLQAEADKAQAERAAAQAAAELFECSQVEEARTAEEARFEALKQADMTELEARRQPMTRYLQERVLPLLHKGLLDVCATRPENPVDYLAEWLIRHNPHDDVFCDL